MKLDVERGLLPDGRPVTKEVLYQKPWKVRIQVLMNRHFFLRQQ